MIPFQNAMNIASEGAKTYADFVAWTLTQGATNASQGDPTWNGAFGLRRVALQTFFSGGMYGSPWGGAPSYGNMDTEARLSRLAQHAALSTAHAEMNMGRIVLIDVRLGYSSGAENSIYGQNRNGFLSSSYEYDHEAFYATANCRRFEYFDDATGKRIKVDPFMQTYEMLDF